MCDNNNSCACLSDVLCTIVSLQRKSDCLDDCNNSCDRPFLGVSANCVLNTRPVTLRACGANNNWSMPYTLNGNEATSSVFRCEAVEDCCATFRILANNTDPTSNNPYVATDSYFTMNLNCLGSLQCLPDTYVACI